MPAMAEPTAAPMIASSAIGVLRTRSSPNFVERPSVQVEHAAAGGVGHVLAHEEHRRVLLHRLLEGLVDGDPERQRGVGLGVVPGLGDGRRVAVDVTGHRRRIGRRIGGGLLVGGVDLGLDPLLDAGQRRLVGCPLSSSHCRKRGTGSLATWAASIVGVHVLVLVAQHVAERPERDALEQHRALAAAGVGDGLDRGLVGGHRIRAVDLDALHGVGRGTVDDRRRLLRVGELRVLAVLVVLADEHDRQVPHRGHVERLVEGADVGGAVAEVADRDPAVALAASDARPSPVATGMPPPTMPVQSISPWSGSEMCIGPPRPFDVPVALPSISAHSSRSGTPLATSSARPAVGGRHVVGRLDGGRHRGRDDLVATDRVVDEEGLGRRR